MPVAPLPPDQSEAMHCALRRAFARMTEPSPVIELVAIRILELANAGEADPDKITETVLSEFGL
jgi:hypothetical protein